MLAIYGFGVQVAYLNFVGDFLSSLSGFFGLSAVFQNRVTWIWAALLMAVPLSVPKSLSALRYCSIMAGVSLLYTTGLVIANTPGRIANGTARTKDWQVGVLSWDLFQALGNFVFAFNCHLNISPVASELVGGHWQCCPPPPLYRETPP